jgi:hypothetical protein
MLPAAGLRLCVMVVLVAFGSTTGFAHPGGLDKNGGHTDKKTGEYHYHKAKGAVPEKSDQPSPPVTPETAAPSTPAPALVPVSAPAPSPASARPPATHLEAPSTSNATTPAPDYAHLIAKLIEPSQLTVLEARGAGARLLQAAALLEQARCEGSSVPELATNSVRLAQYTNAQLASMTCESLIKNHQAAQKLGVFTADGLGEMRRGQSPAISFGPFSGDQLSVAQTIPALAAPELDKTIANLELLPLKVNSARGGAIGRRQYDLARQFHAAGMLTLERMNEILAR